MALTDEEKLAKAQQMSLSNIIPVITDSVVQNSKIKKTPAKQDKNNTLDTTNNTTDGDIQPVRRGRGRPRIIKDYHDPMKSPMASTSLKVQRQGLLEKGGKTVMKIGSLMTFDSPSKTIANSISSYNTPKRMNISKTDTSPTLDKKIRRATKGKNSPKKVVKSVSTGNISLKQTNTSENKTKLTNSVSNGDMTAVLKYMSSSNTNSVQQTPTRSRKGSLTASVNKEINTNSSITELKKKRSRKNSLLINSQLETPYHESTASINQNTLDSKNFNIDTPSSITSLTRKHLSKLSLKLDKNGRAYIEKIEEDEEKLNPLLENGKNYLQSKFVSESNTDASDMKQQFVSMYETQKNTTRNKFKLLAKNTTNDTVNQIKYSEANKDIDMGSSNDDSDDNTVPQSASFEYLNWNNPLLNEKSLNDLEKKKVLSMLKKFNGNSNLNQRNTGTNLVGNEVLLNECTSENFSNNRMKTPPLSQSAQFSNVLHNENNPTAHSQSVMKLNTDEMEIAIPALLELSPMNMSILNKTPNGKFNYNNTTSFGNINMTNPNQNSASKFFHMGSPFSNKYKHLGLEDYDYQKFFSMSPNNKEHVTLNTNNMNKTPINNKDNNQQGLGMMFNIDSVLQSPNNNIFQAFSQAVYSSPLVNNNNNGSKLQHPINLDIKTDNSKLDPMMSEDFFKSFNPIKLNTNSISRSPRIIFDNKKKDKKIEKDSEKSDDK
ncbi:hypothetical protein QEN19_002424 [Hanseniaspora menglaensis]